MAIKILDISQLTKEQKQILEIIINGINFYEKN